MSKDPTLAATSRYAMLEISTLVPTVILWSLVLGAGEFGTMLVLWSLRVVTVAFWWTRAIVPARRWQQLDRTLDDHELLAIDEAMAENPRRFARNYSLLLVATLALGTASSIVFPQTLTIGAAELVTALTFAFAIVVLVIVMQYWLWVPFEAGRSALGALLHERNLSSRRTKTTIVRSQLLLGAVSVLAMYLGCFALGGMVRIQARRAMTLSEQEHLVQLAATRLEVDANASVAGVTIVEQSELPNSLDPRATRVAALEVGLARSEAIAIAAAPIGSGRWVLARAETDEQLGWFVVFMLAVGVFLAIPMTGTSLAQARSLADQLLALGRLTRQVTEDGQIRGLARVISLRNDEVDTLTKHFNAMLDMFDELTNAASAVSEGDLRVEFVRPGELHDAFRGMIERLHAMVVQIRTTSVELAAAAAEIHSITQEQARSAEQQSTSVGEVSQTVASLADSADSISESATSVLGNAEQTLAMTTNMIAEIAELNRQVGGVTALLELIHEIADRSDLLALNGALEATRVGEAGRSFALLAAEMRRLAERVTRTVGDVHEHVVEIEGAGASAVRVAEQSRTLAEQTATAARHISLVTGRQSGESEHVAQTVRTVADAVIASADATGQTREAAERLRDQAEQLERLTRQFKLRQGSSTQRSGSSPPHA